MAGEIQLNSTTLATESSGSITLSNVDSATNRTNLGLGSMATQNVDGFPGRNRLINGAFQVAQRNTSFSGGTDNADDTYTLDRWYVLSEGNDSIDITQQSDSPDSNGKCIRLDVETTGEKFGIAQIIEGTNCIGAIGNTCTLSFYAKVSNARIDTIKAAIVAWSGTEDTVTSDIISAWNADGTTPTLIANATFENTPADLSVTTSWARYELSANVDTASTKNIIIFIWSDDASNAQAGDFLYLTNIQFEAATSVATPFEHRSISVELSLAQRYYAIVSSSARAATGGYLGMHFTFPVTMRAAPSIPLSNYSNGSTNNISSVDSFYGSTIHGVGVSLAPSGASDAFNFGATAAASAEL